MSQFDVLRLGHLGERLLHPQGGQTGRRIVSPALGHQFAHLPQTLDTDTNTQVSFIQKDLNASELILENTAAEQTRRAARVPLVELGILESCVAV